jgi:UDP-N-acetylmuramoyl-L-alanyl-D-glutamate--2,6-diaminopimelate ligase
MKLSQLLEGIALASPVRADAGEIEALGLEYDSRRVQPGCVFFAFPGAKADGRRFAADAIAKGAVAVACESPAPEDVPEGSKVPWIQVNHGREALARMSRTFYGKPDEALKLTGLTGTNGKTTTVYLIDQMLRATGAITGMAGTIHYHVAGEERPAVNTTPESLDLMRMMAETRDRGGSYFNFEVSSHALDLRRVFGLSFHTAVFTNLTRDHLDYHKTMEAYFEAKQRLFDGAGGPPPQGAVINADDPWGHKLHTAASTRRLTYGIKSQADLRAVHVESGFNGVDFRVAYHGHETRLRSPLCGQINVYNLLAAFGAAISLGLEPEQAAAGLGQLTAVPGRFERIDEGQPFLVVVDYAHTDDALRNVILTARALKPKRVITLFGCGGDRDRAKRPLMGIAAAELSDMVIVTSDNPRSEDPLSIINDAMVGVQRHSARAIVEPDRRAAIQRALREAGPGDIVILAGKGHETYQVLKDRVIDFDDRVEARKALQAFGYIRKAQAGAGSSRA